MSYAEHYQNRPMFHEAIQKLKVARFYGLRCTLSTVHKLCSFSPHKFITHRTCIEVL